MLFQVLTSYEPVIKIFKHIFNPFLLFFLIIE